MIKDQTCTTELAEAMNKTLLSISKILNAREYLSMELLKTEYSLRTGMYMLLETI